MEGRLQPDPAYYRHWEKRVKPPPPRRVFRRRLGELSRSPGDGQAGPIAPPGVRCLDLQARVQVSYI